MNKRARFHAIAISAICLVIVLVFSFAAPKPAPVAMSNEPQTSNRIEVYQANWGLNCNVDIARTLKVRQTNLPPRDEKGQVIPYKPLVPAQKNNVILPVSTLCNTQVMCQIEATSTNLGGIDPLETCYKQLEVQYRCFTYDRIHTETVDQGSILTLDCNEKQPPSDQTAAPAAN